MTIIIFLVLAPINRLHWHCFIRDKPFKTYDSIGCLLSKKYGHVNR